MVFMAAGAAVKLREAKKVARKLKLKAKSTKIDLTLNA